MERIFDGYCDVKFEGCGHTATLEKQLHYVIFPVHFAVVKLEDADEWQQDGR